MLLIVFCAFTSCVVIGDKKEQTRSVDDKTAVVNLINDYLGEDKQYTKLSILSYDESAGFYHAGASTRKRRTYYDEITNALLMGDYDGTFDNINSGYAKTSPSIYNMQHYRNNAEVITEENLFSTEFREVNYTLYVTYPTKYFDVLSDVSEIVSLSGASDWTSENNIYTYTTAHPSGYLTNTDPYSDYLLKTFQYFAAPMLLINSSIRFSSVEIEEVAATIGEESSHALAIRLYTTSHELISTAYVVKGLTTKVVVIL